MTFRKGESGNPGGRTPLSPAQRKARELRASSQPDVVRELLKLAKDDALEPRDRIACLKALLEELPKQLEVDDVTPPEKKQASRQDLIALGLGALERELKLTKGKP